MLKLLVPLMVLASLVLASPTSSEDCSTDGYSSSSFSQSSSSSSNDSSESSSSSSSYVNSSENTSNSQCSEDSEPPKTLEPIPATVEPTPVTPNQPNTTPEQPGTMPEQPGTTPEQPVTTPKQPVTTPEQPVTTPKQPTTTPDQTSTSLQKAKENFYYGNSKATADFFYNVVMENPGKSVIMSLYSTLFLMGLLCLFATGSTQTELLTLLNAKSNDEISLVIPAFLQMIDEQKNVNFTLAAKAYGNTLLPDLSDSFKAASKSLLRAESERVDCSASQKTADYINEWISNNTNNKIQDLVPPSLIVPEIVMILVNALYFRGDWAYQFNKDSTVKKEFYKSNDQVIKVDTMHQERKFRYAEIEDLNAQVLELPYSNKNLTCLIILPKEKNGVEDLASKLRKDNALNSILSSLKTERVDVRIPKFKTTTRIDLKENFIKLGVTSMFNSDKTGLRNISADPSVTVLITSALQKCTIDMDETGSEATAANVIIGVGITSVGVVPPPPKQFIANRSFIYHLMFDGTPFFSGLYAGDE